jgi:hypothetical protein
MRRRAILGVLLVGALALRLVAVGDPLSNDEGYTWLVASAHSPGIFLDRLAAFENTPPLYYLLTWPLPDAGVAWLRIVSVLAGVGCVAATYWVASVTASRVERLNVTLASVIAAAAVAVAPFAVSYSDFGRGFVLADLALIVALGAALRRRWWLYAVAGVVAVYAEYDSALFLVALAAALASRGKRDALIAVAPMGALALWLPEALRHSTTKASPVYPAPSPDSLRDSVVRLTFGEHGTAHSPGLRWLQFLLVAAVLIWAFRKAPRTITIVAAGTLVLHAITAWIGPDVFDARYMTELIPLAAIAFGCALAGSRREVQVAAAVAIAAVGIAVAVRRAEGNGQPNLAHLANVIAPAAQQRAVLTNSAVVAYYLRDLHPHLDRPFGLGPGLEAGCVDGCKAGFLIVDDTRVAGGIRTGPGPSHLFGPIYVRGTPQVGGAASVHPEGDMGSLACKIALLVASSLGGLGTPHPMEVTIQDDALFLHQSPNAVQRTANRLAALGVDRLRVTAGWSVLAPAPNASKRPRFDATNSAQYQQGTFRALDTAVKAATNAGLKVDMDIAFWAPKWAVQRPLVNSSRQRWVPDAGQFGQFATAVARRYSGTFADPTSKKGRPLPAVRMFTPWNEPNHPSFLLPQSVRTRGGRWRDIAPQVYRAMYQAAYAAIKKVSPQNQVLLGGLSSRGATHPGPDGNIPPLRFIRDMACVDSQLKPLDDPACHDYQPLQADGFAYHPYSFEAAPNVVYGGPDTVHLADLNRLSDLLKQLHAAGRISSDLPLYLTEYGYESNPPDKARGVPPETQARYMSLASFLAWKNPDTRMFAQFLFQDIADPRSYQTGLLYPNGAAKPALQAFKLPFWAQAQETNGQPYVLIWGQVRPGTGPQTVAVETQHADGSWHTLSSMPAAASPDGKSCPTENEEFLTDENGFYLRLVPYSGLAAYRARWTRPDGGTEYAPPVTVGLPVPASS